VLGLLHSTVYFILISLCLQCFDAVGWATGRASACGWVLAWLSVCPSTSQYLYLYRSTQPCIPPGSLNRVPASTGVRAGNVTSAGWQVTLCDPMWHVSSCSSVATLRTAIHLLLTYLLTNLPWSPQDPLLAAGFPILLTALFLCPRFGFCWLFTYLLGWSSSRVLSVLDSGAEGLGSNRSRDAVGVTVLVRQTVHTHCASVHQAAKLLAALLRVAGVTAGMAESNGSLPPGI